MMVMAEGATTDLRMLFWDAIDPNAALDGSAVIFINAVIYTVPETMAAYVIYELLRMKLLPDPSALETRCRRCRYELRGLSQPQCPECGEPI